MEMWQEEGGEGGEMGRGSVMVLELQSLEYLLYLQKNWLTSDVETFYEEE